MNDAAVRRALHEAQSGDDHTRGLALQSLWLAVKDRPHPHPHPQLHSAARAVFEAALQRETEPWPLTVAARGLERTADRDTVRAAWLDLLRRKDDRLAAHAAIAVGDPWFVPELLAMLGPGRSEMLRINVIAALGQLRDPRAVDALIAETTHADPAPRAYAARALGQIGDPRAIPALHALLTDDGPAWPLDNHGPMVLIRDVAAEAIASPTLLKDKPSWLGVLPVAPPLAPLADASLWRAGLIYLPLLIAVLEIPILFILVQAVRSPHPQLPPLTAKQQIQRVDLLAAIAPALAIGLSLFFAWPRFGDLRWWERAALIAGTLACAAFLYALGKEYVRAG